MMLRVLAIPEALVVLTLSVSLVSAFVIVWARECP